MGSRLCSPPGTSHRGDGHQPPKRAEGTVHCRAGMGQAAVCRVSSMPASSPWPAAALSLAGQSWSPFLHPHQPRSAVLGALQTSSTFPSKSRGAATSWELRLCTFSAQPPRFSPRGGQQVPSQAGTPSLFAPQLNLESEDRHPHGSRGAQLSSP